MEKQTKIAKFVEGPLGGQTRKVDNNQSIYKHELPPTSDDILPGEIPIGFFPPIHEYIYEETPEGSGTFVFKEQHH